MEPVKTLIKLWKADKHIPDGESIKSLLPKKNEQVKCLHGLAMQPDLVSAIKLTLSTLHTAWQSLEAGLCISDDLDDLDMNQDALTTEELLVIARVVPLFIPEEMARSLQASHIVRKRKHEGSDDESEKQKLSLEEMLKVSDDDDNKFGGFFSSSTSVHQSKRTRVDSALLGDSEESADEGSSESDSEPSARKKSESPDSVVLVSAKAKNTGDHEGKDGGKKGDKERTILQLKSRAHRQKSEDNAAEDDIKAEDKD